MSELAQYGEPWAAMGGHHVEDSDGFNMATFHEDLRWTQAAFQRRDRAVACVNALAGVPDPAAFVAECADLRATAERLVLLCQAQQTGDNPLGLSADIVLHRARAALAGKAGGQYGDGENEAALEEARAALDGKAGGI